MGGPTPTSTPPARLLVAGGAGFIGGCFVRDWLAAAPSTSSGEAPTLVVLDKLTYAAAPESLPLDDPRLRLVEGDIVDAELVARLMHEHSPDAVVNFAAETHVDRSIDAPEPFLMTNVVGVCHLLEGTLAHWRRLDAARREAFRFLQVSTDEVFGSAAGRDRFDESSPYRPNSPYSASKAAGDHFVRAFRQTYGLPTLTTHAANNFGPYQFPEKLVPVIIMNALEGRPLPIYGDGRHVRDWLHVSDHSRALRLVLERGAPGEAYNIGAGREHENLEVVRLLCRILDTLRPDLPHSPCESLIEFVPDRPGHDRRYALDDTKLRTLGWRGAEPLERRLTETIGWYLEHADWTAARGAPHRARRGLNT